MGRQQAEEMVTLLKEDQALQWHLQYNHYPPIDLAFVPIAQKAIELAKKENWEEVIKMPNGKSLTVVKIIEGMHLETFLEELSNDQSED